MSDHVTNSLSKVAEELSTASEQSLIFERFLPASEIVELCAEFGYQFRDRVYSPVVTLWMFLGQTLSADHSCRDAVMRLNAWRVDRGKDKVGTNTTSYPTARQRLPEEMVAELARRSGRKCVQAAKQNWQWKGRPIKMADGMTLTMPDTPRTKVSTHSRRVKKRDVDFLSCDA